MRVQDASGSTSGAGDGASYDQCDVMPAQPASAFQWHALEAEQVLATVGATSGGLSDVEAEQRRLRYGRNALPQDTGRSLLERIGAQLNNMLIYVLLGSALLTAFLGHFVDTGVIIAVVVVNAVIGLIQEGKAEQALDAIRSMVAPGATVLREGRRSEVDAEELVPGDIVLLEAGDRVAADLRIIRARSLHIDEAVLTGESVPVDKGATPVHQDAVLGDQAPMAFSGTFVAAGQGTGVVVATGVATELGQITTLIGKVETLTTPLIRKMNGFAHQLSVAILGICAGTLLFAIFVRDFSIADAFMAVVGMAVAAIPEGLPAVMTITLAIGVQRMAERNAIIRRLPAVETLGSVGVICTDKTGTLTRNEMTVRVGIVGRDAFDILGTGYEPTGAVMPRAANGSGVIDAGNKGLRRLARAAALCNDAELARSGGTWKVNGDPMEGALLAFAAKVLGDAEGTDTAISELRGAMPRIDTIPFDAETRYMASLHALPGDANGVGEARCIVIAKGAPERLLDMCRLEISAGEEVAELDADYWRGQIDDCAAEGQRTLMLAERVIDGSKDDLSERDLDDGLVLIGLVSLIDPPRSEAIDAVAQAQSAGIRIKMITGDHAATAAAIGRQLGLADAGQVLTGAEFAEVPPESLPDVARRTGIFARTSPEQKLRLVEALQSDGSVVAMTGDGVNDAPALKRADVGVAMGVKGTEAAKEAAAMVLADDNFASIAAAVREGRTVYDNLTKVIGWTLPTSFGETVIIMVAILLGFAMPVLPVQILWVNMVTAVGLGLVLGFEPPSPGIMRRRPLAPDEPILSGVLVWQILFVSALFVAGCFGVFQLAMSRGYDIETARTMVVNQLVVMEIFYLCSVRFIGQFGFGGEFFRVTRVLVIGVGTVVILQLAFTYLPPFQAVFRTTAISLADWGLILAIGGMVFAAVEVEKVVRQPILAHLQRARQG